MGSFFSGNAAYNTVVLVAQHHLRAMAQLSIRLHELHLQPKMRATHSRQVIGTFRQHVDQHVLNSLRRLQHALRGLETQLTSPDEALKQLREIHGENEALMNHLFAVQPVQPTRELDDVLETLLPLSLLPGKQSRLCVLENDVSTMNWPFADVVLEHLPTTYRDMPTHWSPAFNASLLTLAAQLKTNPSRVENRTAQLLGVRVLGPGHYYEMVLHALIYQEYEIAAHLEPLMFEFLNHLNIASDHAVRFHSSVQGLLSKTLGEARAEEIAKEIEAEEFSTLFSEIEALIPEAHSFGPRHLQTAKRLIDRLHDGLPACALPQHDLADLRDRLEALDLTEEAQDAPDYEALHVQNAIYQLIPQVQEAPVCIREMMAAAWLQRLETASDEVEPFLSLLDTDEALHHAWDAYWPQVQAAQQRFMKSIETVRLHNALLGQPIQGPSLNAETHTSTLTPEGASKINTEARRPSAASASRHLPPSLV